MGSPPRPHPLIATTKTRQENPRFAVALAAGDRKINVRYMVFSFSSSRGEFKNSSFQRTRRSSWPLSMVARKHYACRIVNER